MSNDQDRTDEQAPEEKKSPRSKIRTRAQIEQESGAAPMRQPTPSSLLAYVAVILGMFVFWAVFPGYPPLELEAQLATSVFVRLLVVFLLINRSFIGWVIGIVIEAIYIIVFSLQISSQGPAEAAKLWGLLFITIAALALLLTRQTRQHIFAPDPEIIAQQSGDPEQERQGEVDQANSPSSSPPSSSPSSSSSSSRSSST